MRVEAEGGAVSKTARVNCTCGDVLTTTLPMELDSFAKMLQAWAKNHKAPDHIVCDSKTAANARRRKRRAGP